MTAGDPFEMPNAWQRMTRIKSTFERSDTDTHRGAAAAALLAALAARAGESAEFSVSSDKGATPPTSGEWAAMLEAALGPATPAQQGGGGQ